MMNHHIKLGIKPVFIGVIGKKEAQKRNHEIVKYLEQNLTDEAKILISAILEKEEDLRKLAPDLEETDLHLVYGAPGGTLLELFF